MPVFGGAARINMGSAVAICFSSQTLLASMFRILMAPWCCWTAKGNTVLITAPAPPHKGLHYTTLPPTSMASFTCFCVFRWNTSCWPHRNAIQKGLIEPAQALVGVNWKIKQLFSLVLDLVCVQVLLLEVSLSSPYLGLIIPSHLEFLSPDSENLTGIVHMASS